MPEGYIIRCTPVVGSPVKEGTEIKVVLSLGQKATTKDISIKLPSSGMGSIVYKLNGNTVHTVPSQTFYSQLYTASVTGVGSSDAVEVYVNDNLYFSCTVDFTQSPPAVSGVTDYTGTIDYGTLY